MINTQRSKPLAHCALVVLSLCLVGCSTFFPSPGETPLPVTLTPSSTVVPSPSPEPPTSTPTPSPVPATHTPHPTRTPIPTPTSPPPTLTANEERLYVQEMLATNGGCELPCWWGVTPGQSDLQSVIDYFLAHGVGFYSKLLSAEGLNQYYVLHDFTDRNGVIQFIEVTSESFRGVSGQFTRDWSRYSLDQVLARYGVPSRVRIVLALPVEAGGPIYYILYVFYDDLGIGIRYLGPALEKNELLHTCFLFEDITLWLQSPECSTPLHHAINLDEWSFAVPLEEATGMSVEEFYEVFRHPGECLEAPPTF